MIVGAGLIGLKCAEGLLGRVTGITVCDLADRVRSGILDTERAGIYTSLIRERTPLDTIDFETMKKVATSVAFSPENRRKKFGGVV